MSRLTELIKLRRPDTCDNRPKSRHVPTTRQLGMHRPKWAASKLSRRPRALRRAPLGSLTRPIDPALTGEDRADLRADPSNHGTTLKLHTVLEPEVISTIIPQLF